MDIHSSSKKLAVIRLLIFDNLIQFLGSKLLSFNTLFMYLALALYFKELSVIHVWK